MEMLDEISAAALAPSAADAGGGDPGEERTDREVRTTPREMTLARFVYDTFLENERFAVERGFHDQMRESWRLCRSEHSAADEAKLSALGLPKDLFEPVTEVRRFAALSQLKEIFSSGGQFPAKLSSTANPDVPPYVTERLLRKILDELMQVSMVAGVQIGDDDVVRFVTDRRAELMRAQKEHSDSQIETLERMVRDDFEEGGFLDAFNEGVEYLTVYGTAVWEGPVPCVAWRNRFTGKGGARIRREPSKAVAFRAVNPLDVYPSPDQTDIEDGAVCIRVRIPPHDLWLNAKETGGDAETGVWFRDTVADLLAKYPDGGVRLSWRDGEEDNREMRGQSCWSASSSCMMEGISYYGRVKGSLLVRMGVERTHGGGRIDPGDYYEVNAVVIDEYCVYCRIIDPCLGRPLSKAHFYAQPDSFFGGSIAQRLVAHQRILNSCLKTLVVNMNMTCAPQVWISDAARLLDRSPTAMKMYGGKVWAFKATAAGVSVGSGAPMGVLRVDSRIPETLALMNATISRVDDVSGIPSYTYGQNVTGGAGRTYSGLAMLTEAANRVMKMVIDTLDRDVIRRMVKADAYRLMMYDGRVEYSGDVEVNPTGVMGLILKQQEMQKVLQLMQMVVSNQFLVQTVGARGLMEIFRQVLKTYDVANIDKIIPSKEHLDLQEFLARARQAAGLEQAAANAAQAQGQAAGGQAQDAQGGAVRPPATDAAEYAGGPQGYGQGAGAQGEAPVEAPGSAGEPAPGSAGERRGAA